MLRERRAAIRAGAEEHRLPEAVERRHVRRPVDLRHVVEDRAEQRVTPHVAVEAVYQQCHIVGRRDVHAVIYYAKASQLPVPS